MLTRRAARLGWSALKARQVPRQPNAGIRVSLTKPRGPERPAELHLSFNAQASGALGLSAGDRLEVMLGTDESLGLLRFRKNNSIGTATLVGGAPTPRRPAFLIAKLGHLPDYINQRREGKRCRYREIKEAGAVWIEISMPDWSRDLSKPAQGRPGLPALAPPQRRVVGAMMGDPSPERAALASKTQEPR